MVAVESRCGGCGRVMQVSAQAGRRAMCPHCRRPGRWGVWPWLVSLLVHAGVLASTASVYIFIVESGDGDIVIPDVRLSDTPGGQFHEPPEILQLPTPPEMKQAMQSPSTPSPDRVVVPKPAPLQSAPLAGMTPMAAGAMADLRPDIADPAVQPQSQFFGTGGNAHHVVYVVDWSGSMVDQASYQAVRRELLRSLGKLQSRQDFHIILFAEGNLHENPPMRLVSATKAEKLRAARFMRDMPTPELETEVLPALRRAFDVLKLSNGRPGKLIYLLTDGEFKNNAAVLALLNQANADRKVKLNTLLFRFRPPLSEYILKRIAAENGGTYTYVDDD